MMMEELQAFFKNQTNLMEMDALDIIYVVLPYKSIKSLSVGRKIRNGLEDRYEYSIVEVYCVLGASCEYGVFPLVEENDFPDSLMEEFLEQIQQIIEEILEENEY